MENETEMPRDDMSDMPEDYVEANRKWAEKVKEMREKQYQSRFGTVSADELVELEREVAELKKIKMRLYSRCYYHRAIKKDEEAYARRRDLDRENKKKTTQKISISRAEKRRLIELLAQYEVQAETGDLIILKKKN